MPSALLEDRHLRVLRSVEYTLILRDQPDAWRMLAGLLEMLLTPHERVRLLVAAAEATETEPLIKVFEEIVPIRLVGAPLPVFDQIEDDARWWSNLATQPELRAWLIACFVRLPVREQDEFLASAKRMVST